MRDINAEVNSMMAVIRMGIVGEESMNKLKTQVATMETILIRAVWNPNAVPLKRIFWILNLIF